VVIDTDTVVDPGAVVVEPVDALVADGAVLAPWRSDDFTIRAHFTRVYLREHIHKRKLLLNIARITTRRHSERYSEHKRQPDHNVSIDWILMVWDDEQNLR